MIRYSLTCDSGHGFDSWFRNAAAFEALDQAHQLTCPVCGSGAVSLALMAPAVQKGRAAEAPPTPARAGLAAPASELEQAIAEMRRQVEANSEYVGVNFVSEARRMHEGAAPERSIYGEARPEEARKLLEEGVPVAPLPFLPARKSN
jgi:hypothetical protein